MILRLGFFGFWILLLFLSPPLKAEEKKESIFERVDRTGILRCGFIPWPPGYEIDPNTNEVRGITKELFEGIIKLTGWRTEFIETSLANIPLDLDSGKIDAVCGDGPWTLTNIKVVDYTMPAVYTPVVIYVRIDDIRFKNYSDFNRDEVTFIGIDGDTSVDLAQLRFPRVKIRTLANLTDPAQMLMEVASGKADAVIIDPVTGDNFAQNNPGKIRAFSIQDPLAVYPLGFSLKRGEARLHNVLNRATEMAINIGFVDQKVTQYDPTGRTAYAPLKLYEVDLKK